MSELKLQWIIEHNTALLTYDQSLEFLLLVPSDFPAHSPFLAMPPSVIPYINCPNDLEYSHNRPHLLSRASRFS